LDLKEGSPGLNEGKKKKVKSLGALNYLCKVTHERIKGKEWGKEVPSRQKQRWSLGKNLFTGKKEQCWYWGEGEPMK